MEIKPATADGDRATVALAFSGGIDSTTLLYSLNQLYLRVIAVTVDYGQRARYEIVTAERIAKNLGVEYIVCHTDYPVFSGDEQPNRNMVILSLVAAHAARFGADLLMIGSTKSDAARFADCRLTFIDAMAAALATSTGIKLSAPFAIHTKTELVAYARRIRVPLEKTWSCYKFVAELCGESLGCTERAAALGAK